MTTPPKRLRTLNEPMKSLLTTICGVALFAAIAGAQTSSTTSTTTTTASSPAAATTTTTSSTTESTGTITEFTPGSAIVLNTGAGEPVRYKLGSSVPYINAQ